MIVDTELCDDMGVELKKVQKIPKKRNKLLFNPLTVDY